MQVHVVIFFGSCKAKNMNQIHPQLFRWPLHPNDIYKMAQNTFHSSVHRWSNIQGYQGIDMKEVKPASLSSSSSSLTHAVGARHWRTAQSPCPSDTRMGSSQTATAATESKWQSRNTWRPSSGKGIDRELETKDAGSHICSTVLSQTSKKKHTQKNKQTTKLKCVPPQMKLS